MGLDALAQLVEYSRDGIAVLDEQLRVLYVNPAGCEILGYPLEQLIGRSGLLMIPAERHEEVPAVLQKIVELAAEVADAPREGRGCSQRPPNRRRPLDVLPGLASQ